MNMGFPRFDMNGRGYNAIIAMPRVARIVSVFLGEVDRNPMEICERNGTVGHDFMVPGDFIRLFELIYWKAAGGGRARAGCQTLA